MNNPKLRASPIYRSLNTKRLNLLEALLLSLVINTTSFISPVNAQSTDVTPQSPAQSAPPVSPPLPIEPVRQKSYIGVGPAFGLGGSSTALSTGGLAVFSKTVLTDNLSIHSTNVYFGSSIPSSSANLTIDFPIRDSNSGKILFSPFLGGGVMTRNENRGLYISPHATGGIDLPLSMGFTATIHLDVGFPNNRKADIGLLTGVGFSF